MTDAPVPEARHLRDLTPQQWKSGIAAAAASVVFGWLAPVGDFRTALLYSSFLALAAAIWAWWLPEDSKDT